VVNRVLFLEPTSDNDKHSNPWALACRPAPRGARANRGRSRGELASGQLVDQPSTKLTLEVA
jgi:hypothetical protein